MRILITVALLVLLTGVSGKADDALPCFEFSGPASIIVSHQGQQFTVSATFTNNCPEGYIAIGSSFGSDLDPYLALRPVGAPMMDFFDPSFFLAPGESKTTPFSWYEWSAETPEHYLWTATIGAEYTLFAEPCYRPTDLPCVVLAPRGWKETTFTTTVAPEPSAFLLMGTGLFLVWRKRRK